MQNTLLIANLRNFLKYPRKVFFARWDFTLFDLIARKDKNKTKQIEKGQQRSQGHFEGQKS